MSKRKVTMVGVSNTMGERPPVSDCDCFGWGRSSPLWETHHPNCKHYAPVQDVLRLLEPLIEGIEAWAGDEDGVHPECWDAYKRARLAVGRPVPREDRNP